MIYLTQNQQLQFNPDWFGSFYVWNLSTNNWAADNENETNDFAQTLENTNTWTNKDLVSNFDCAILVMRKEKHWKRLIFESDIANI